jgi:hypothetical protein
MIRNVEKTGPYFHDDSVSTRSDALGVMAKVQLDEELDPEQFQLIAAFLNSLTGVVASLNGLGRAQLVSSRLMTTKWNLPRRKSRRGSRRVIYPPNGKCQDICSGLIFAVTISLGLDLVAV